MPQQFNGRNGGVDGWKLKHDLYLPSFNFGATIIDRFQWPALCFMYIFLLIKLTICLLITSNTFLHSRPVLFCGCSHPVADRQPRRRRRTIAGGCRCVRPYVVGGLLLGRSQTQPSGRADRHRWQVSKWLPSSTYLCTKG